MIVPAKSELKSCPFCACKDINVERTEMEPFEQMLVKYQQKYWYECWCNKCGAHTAEHAVQEEAENLWNARA